MNQTALAVNPATLENSEEAPDADERRRYAEFLKRAEALNAQRASEGLPPFTQEKIERQWALDEEIRKHREARERRKAQEEEKAWQAREQGERKQGDLMAMLARIQVSARARAEAKAEVCHPPMKEAPPPERAKEEPPQEAQLILFPQWGDERRGAAAAIFRSALFPPLNFKKARPFLKEVEIYATRGLEVHFTGEQFDQSDLDVYLELLHIARETPFGVECCFTAYGLLKALGRSTGQANHKWLHSVLIRLCGGVVDITNHQTGYFGHLVESGIKDEITRHYRVRLNPEMARLFRGNLWASLDVQQRRTLGRSQTAKALHAYYSTHANPGPHRYETLAAIIGLKNSCPRDTKRKLIRAHEELKQIGFSSDFEAGEDTITPQVNHTASQNRHIMKKATESAAKPHRRRTDANQS